MNRMVLAYVAYRFFSSLIFLLAYPFLRLYSAGSWKHSESMAQRLGRFPTSVRREQRGDPCVWMHAVSVGEAGAALSIIKSLKKRRPNASIILSVTTFYGHKFATERLDSDVRCIYAPIDFPVSVKNALTAFKPDALVCLETEIWPNLLVGAKRMGIRTGIVNGRISERSIKGYLKIRSLMAHTLSHVDVLSMIQNDDFQRMRRLGAKPERMEINGNAKYDVLLSAGDVALKQKMERLYNPQEGQIVFIAGSTRSHEEIVILDVYEKIIRVFPNALLIIFPRHIKRSGELMSLAIQRGFSCQLRTRLDERPGSRTAQVVIGDTIGELCAAYGIATLVFCGGSLAEKGGQNILEPAAWGKLLFYGPSMGDFMDAKKLLDKTGGGVQVKDGDDLAKKALHYLSHPQEAEKIKRGARQAAGLNQGAADKHARVICDLASRGG